VGANFSIDIERSVEALLHVVIAHPRVSYRLGGGRFISMEKTGDPFKDLLDMGAGIDVVQAMPDGHMRAIASRVQPIEGKCWDTFTMRRERANGVETERVKRFREARNGSYMTPGLMMHAYINGDQLVNVGIAKTKSVLLAMETKNNKPRINPVDGNLFDWVDFKDVRGAWTLDWHELPGSADEDWIKLPGHLPIYEYDSF